MQSEPEVFGGIRRDVEVASDFLGPQKPEVRPMSILLGMAAVADIPLSAAADIVLLPVTIPVTLLASSYDREAEVTKAPRSVAAPEREPVNNLPPQHWSPGSR
jgi:hypothetical protein